MFADTLRQAYRSLASPMRALATKVPATTSSASAAPLTTEQLGEYVVSKYRRDWTRLYPDLRANLNADNKRPTGMVIATAVKDLITVGLLGIVVESQINPPG